MLIVKAIFAVCSDKVIDKKDIICYHILVHIRICSIIVGNFVVAMSYVMALYRRWDIGKSRSNSDCGQLFE